jgi:signal transduction histidine kinase
MGDWVEGSESELEQLLYTVSHELKSPLVTVLGYLDLLRGDATQLTPDAALYVERMEVSALHMHQLINDLLLLSRIGRMDGTPQDVDLTRVATEVRDELQPKAPRATVEIGALPVVHMSPVRARQLLECTIANALIHAGKDDVHVEVGAERLDGDAARLWVADDGCGVPEGERERAFGVFERLGERPAGEGGTGVGLAVTRKIVEHVDGSVRFADAPVGATVEIVLPATVVRWQRTVAGIGS